MKSEEQRCLSRNLLNTLIEDTCREETIGKVRADIINIVEARAHSTVGRIETIEAILLRNESQKKPQES
jgi:hypothetical protein